MAEIPDSKLSDIEHYLFLDNHPAFPLDFTYRLQFDGHLNTPLLTQCLQQALELHPLLSATVERKRRHWFWKPQRTQPTITVVSSGEEDCLRPPIDLQKENGVRLIAIEHAETTCLLFEFHHTATDGLGAMGFISDVLRLYSGTDPSEVTRDSNLLKQRHYCGYPIDSWSNYVMKHIRVIGFARLFLAVKLSPIVNCQPDKETPRTKSSCTRHVSYTLIAEETGALRDHARTKNVSLNTLLVRDAFIALDHVRQGHEGYHPDDNIRIVVPGDQRSTRSNVGFPAANYFSMIFPHKNGKQIADEDQLLHDVNQEVKSARADYFLAVFRLGLKIFRLIPGQIEGKVNADECQATTLLTNVGTALSEINRPACSKLCFNGVSLDSIELVAPVRPFQTVAISTIEYAGEQVITLTYDPLIHNDAEASSILQTFIRQLQCRIETRTATPVERQEPSQFPL